VQGFRTTVQVIWSSGPNLLMGTRQKNGFGGECPVGRRRDGRINPLEGTEGGKQIFYNSWKIKNFSAISVVRF
jgi:hypothetical protein